MHIRMSVGENSVKAHVVCRSVEGSECEQQSSDFVRCVFLYTSHTHICITHTSYIHHNHTHHYSTHTHTYIATPIRIYAHTHTYTSHTTHTSYTNSHTHTHTHTYLTHTHTYIPCASHTRLQDHLDDRAHDDCHIINNTY